jgi:hypothetical protein
MTFTSANFNVFEIIAVSSFWCFGLSHNYRGADKSLARLGRKQATATEDFDFHISYLWTASVV